MSKEKRNTQPIETECISAQLTPFKDLVWNLLAFLMPFLWFLKVAFLPVWFFCCGVGNYTKTEQKQSL